YHFEGVSARLHVAKLDATTLPAGARLATLGTRNALDAGSRFVDLKNGELSRADFVVGSCTPAVLGEVEARRELGEVRSAICSGQPTVSSWFDPGATRALAGTPVDGAGTAARSEAGVYH